MTVFNATIGDVIGFDDAFMACADSLGDDVWACGPGPDAFLLVAA